MEQLEDVEQLEDMCKAGERILIDKDYFNDKVAAQLKLYSYFWILNENYEDPKGCESLLFVQAVRPKNIESLEDAWNLGKNVVIMESEKGTWASVLSRFQYSCKVGEPDQVLVNQERTSMLRYYVGSNSLDLEEGTLQIFSGNKSSHNDGDGDGDRDGDGDGDGDGDDDDDDYADDRGDDDGWHHARCFLVDTSKSIEKPILSLPFEDKKQTISIQLSVHPSARKFGEFDHEVRLKTVLVQVGVPSKEFLRKEYYLGYFADFIKLSFKPSWATNHPSPFTFQPNNLPMGEGSLVKRTTTSSIAGEIGYRLQFKCGKTWEKQWEDVKQSHGIRIINEGEDGSIASFEWALLRWGGKGHRRKYRDTYTFLDALRLFTKGGKPPELPFDGTGPRLQNKFPEITWVVPNKALDDDIVSVEITLHARMQLFWCKKKHMGFRVPCSTVQPWELNEVHHFAISPIS